MRSITKSHSLLATRLHGWLGSTEVLQFESRAMFSETPNDENDKRNEVRNASQSESGGENSASAQNPQPSRSQAEMSDMQLRDWVDSLVQNPEGNLTSTERQKVAQSQTSSPARDSQIRPNLGTGFRQKTSPKRNVPQSPSTSSIDPDDWGSYGVAEESEVKSNLPARQSDQFDRVPTPASKNPNGQKTAIRPWQSSRPNLQSNNRNFQQNAQGPMFSYRGQQNQNRPVQNSNRYPQNLQNQNTRYAQNPRYPQNNRFPPARPQMASRTEDSREYYDDQPASRFGSDRRGRNFRDGSRGLEAQRDPHSNERPFRRRPRNAGEVDQERPRRPQVGRPPRMDKQLEKYLTPLEKMLAQEEGQFKLEPGEEMALLHPQTKQRIRSTLDLPMSEYHFEEEVKRIEQMDMDPFINFSWVSPRMPRKEDEIDIDKHVEQYREAWSQETGLTSDEEWENFKKEEFKDLRSNFTQAAQKLGFSDCFAEERQLNAYVDCVPKHHPMHGHVKDAVLELNRNPFWRQDQKIEFMEHELNTARIMTDVIWGKYRPREEVEQLLQELEEGEEGFHDSVDQDQIDQERSSIEA